MTFWNRVARGVAELRGDPLNNPVIPLSAAGFLTWLMGGEPTAAGEVINETTALQQNTIYTCVRVISGDCASLPFRLFRVDDSGRKEDAESDLSYILRYEPNDEMTAFTFWESLFGSMALTGNGYAQIQRHPYSQKPVALWPLHPRLTFPKRINNELVYETTDGESTGKTRIIKAADMLHVPLFSFNGVYGFNPIQLARQGIGLARAAEKFGGRFFGNGARPSGVLSSSGALNPKQSREMKDTWKETVGGENNGGIAVLPGEWTYHQIGISPEDSQFLQTRNYQRTELAALFGVPPHRAGDTSRMSNNNAEEQNLSYVIDTLRVYLSRAEQEVKRKLLPKTGRNAGVFEGEFDVSERLRGDFKKTMDGFAVGRQWGIYTTNQVLVKMGENPIGPAGDVRMVPVNMQNAELLLVTESIQDQPVGSDPNAPDGGAGEPSEKPEEKPEPKPAPAKRTADILGSYTGAYIGIFKDAFGRCLNRDKRGIEVLSALFKPTFQAIAERSAGGEAVPAGVVEGVLQSMAKRAAIWPRNLKPEEDLALAGAEFFKCVRSLHVNTVKELTAAKAAQELREAA